MNVELALFYFFSTILVVASLVVITIRNPVHAALSLVLAFVVSAGIWILLEAEFLAITLILVYVGAVMVLFMFVVMMLDVDLVPLKEGFTRYLPIGALIALVVIVELAMVLGGDRFGLENIPDPIPKPEDYSNTKELGRILYTTYVYPFELAAVVLVVAIVAAIAITMRGSRQKKYVTPEFQVGVRRNDRVRIVKMAAEKRGASKTDNDK
ncbi:MAG: NADH-quinone oxidoreductase subunit J [Gammaproteobacteria bacterium]|nr:NADH-quinone oxidoreductase subunit J [Gammaproteobacteria bacterium]